MQANNETAPSAGQAHEEVRIERMSYGAAAIGRLSSGKTVFVDGGAPGDLAEIEVVEEKERFARARLARIIEPSEARELKMKCTAGCGGCPWAHLRYDAQIDAKRRAVVDALVRTAHVEAARAEELVGACVPSKRQWGYRNKLELACGTDAAGHFTLGFYREGTHEVTNPGSCPLANRYIERAPKALRGALRFLQRSQDLGIYRVGVRGSLRTHSVEIALWTPPSAFPRAAVARTLKDALKATSIVRVLADREDYRARIEARRDRFMQWYPRIVVGCAAAGIAVPIVLAAVFALTPTEKVVLLTGWLALLVLLFVGLTVVESLRDSLDRQLRLGALSVDELQGLYAYRNRMGHGEHAEDLVRAEAEGENSDEESEAGATENDGLEAGEAGVAEPSAAKAPANSESESEGDGAEGGERA